MHAPALLLLATTLLLLAPAASADVSFVPGDFPLIQDAIDAASPGDTIVVGPGDWPRIRITKPLTIVGDATGGTRPTIHGPHFSDPDTSCFDNGMEPVIGLDGPGSGVVTLAHLVTSTADCGDGVTFPVAPTISGTGFDELRILDCDLQPIEFDGPPGNADPPSDFFDPVVPRIVIVRCRITGPASTADPFFSAGCFTWDGGVALDVPGSDVWVHDSAVTGGKAADNDQCCECSFLTCDDWGDPTTGDGTGGAAIRAASVRHSGSVIEGGEGAFLTWTHDETGDPLSCQQDSGAPFEAPLVIALDQPLSASGPISVSAPWTLTAELTPSTQLVLSPLPLVPPLPLGAFGDAYFDVGAFVLLPLPGNGVQDVVFTPTVAHPFLGVTVVFQLFEPGVGLSTPTWATIVP